jgi:hypothetical protein
MNRGCFHRLLGVPEPELALALVLQLVLVQTIPTSAQTLLGAQLVQTLKQLEPGY